MAGASFYKYLAVDCKDHNIGGLEMIMIIMNSWIAATYEHVGKVLWDVCQVLGIGSVSAPQEERYPTEAPSLLL